MKDVICLYNINTEDIKTELRSNSSIVLNKEKYLFFIVLHDFFKLNYQFQPGIKNKYLRCLHYGYSVYNDNKMSIETRKASIEEISESMINNISSVKNINIIGGIEINRLIRPSEERILSAAVIAYRKTNKRILIAIDINETFIEQKQLVNILFKNGVNPEHIIVSGVVPSFQNIPKIIFFVQKGIKFIFRDFFNKRVGERFIFEEQMVAIKQMVRLRLTENIMFSVDSYNRSISESVTSFEKMIYELKRIGIEENNINKIIKINPQQLLFKN